MHSLLLISGFCLLALAYADTEKKDISLPIGDFDGRKEFAEERQERDVKTANFDHNREDRSVELPVIRDFAEDRQKRFIPYYGGYSGGFGHGFGHHGGFHHHGGFGHWRSKRDVDTPKVDTFDHEQKDFTGDRTDRSIELPIIGDFAEDRQKRYIPYYGGYGHGFGGGFGHHGGFHHYGGFGHWRSKRYSHHDSGHHFGGHDNHHDSGHHFGGHDNHHNSGHNFDHHHF